MKKLVSMVLSMAMVLSLAGCGSSEPAASAAEPAAPEAPAASEAAAYEPGQFNIKIGTVTSGTHCWVQTANFIKEELESRSNGAITVDVYEGGQLGSDEDMITDLQLGTQDMIIGGTQNAVPFVPELGMLSMHYLFPSRDDFERILNAEDINAYLDEKFDAQDLHLLGLANGGGRTMFTTKEVKGLSDIKNLKMRVTSSSTENTVWSALGTLPTSMSFNDVYSAAQTNTVNAFECTLAAYKTNALYEVAPYMVLTQHQFTPTEMSYSKVLWEKLPADIQELISEVSAEALAKCTSLADEADDSLVSELESENGVTVCEVDKNEFKSVVEPLYDDIAAAAGEGGAELLDMIRAEL